MKKEKEKKKKKESEDNKKGAWEANHAEKKSSSK